MAHAGTHEKRHDDVDRDAFYERFQFQLDPVQRAVVSRNGELRHLIACALCDDRCNGREYKNDRAEYGHHEVAAGVGERYGQCENILDSRLEALTERHLKLVQCQGTTYTSASKGTLVGT